MKKLSILLSIVTLLTAFSASKLHSQTAGTLSVSVTTTEPAGNYTGVHVIALWITDTNNVFVKTKIRYAGTRIQYLTRWIAQSAYNTTDAVTGATRLSHGTLTFNWNGTNVAGDVVTDKPYRIWVQMSDANLPGQYTYFTFTKDTNSQSLTPADTMNFTNISLNWNPSIGIREDMASKLIFRCSPNPVSKTALIAYTLPDFADVTITLHDLTGKTIQVIVDENQNAGAHVILWTSTGISKGAYYLRINTGKATSAQKIIVQ